MRKILLLLSILFCSIVSFSQGIVPRSGVTITAQDARSGAKYNFYVPHTHGLTLNGGLDSVGAVIYEDSSQHFWYRDTVLLGGHKWTMVLKPGDVVGGVSSFNTRTGAITLTNGDVTTALGGVPLFNITSYVTGGSNVTLGGLGTLASPYVINAASGPGTVTTFGFTNGNGLTGTVTNPTSTPGLSLGTSLNGLIKGNGTGFGTVAIGSGLIYDGTTLSVSSGGGSVTTVGFTNANGITGTVSNPTTTPNITLGTGINGLVSGNGTGFAAVTIGAGLSFGSNTLTNTINNTNQLTNGAGFLTNITGLVTAGSNVTLTGSGTSGSPYSISVAGAGTGTVTNFSAGNLAPFFTTSVSNPTTIPGLTFTISNAAALSVLGNNTGSSAAPAYFVPNSTVLNSWFGATIGTVTGVTNSDGTITIGGTSAAPTVSLALGHANTWTGVQTQPAPIFTSLTSSGANDSVLTVDPSTGQVHRRSGTLNLFMGNLMTQTGGDTLNVGGTAINNTTLAMGSFSLSITGLPNKATALGTDSVPLIDLAGKLWKLPVPSGGGAGISLTPWTYPGNATATTTTTQTPIGIKIFTPEMFGGVADSSTDNSVALQKWIDTSAAYGGIAFLPASALPYLYSTGLITHVGKPVHIMGAIGPTVTYTNNFATTTDAGGSRLIYTGTTGIAIHNLSNGSIFENFNLKCNASTATASTNAGLYLDSANTCLVSNVEVNNFNEDFKKINGVFAHFQNTHAVEPHLYGYHVAGYPGLDAGDDRFDNVYSFPTDTHWSATDTCFEYDNAGGIHIDDCKLGGSLVGINSNFQGFTDFEVKGTSIEAIGKTAIRIAVQPGKSLQNLQLIGNQMTFLGTRGIDIDASASGATVQGGIVMDNIIAGPSSTDTGVYVHGNVFNLIVGPQQTNSVSSPVVNASTGTPTPSIAIAPQFQQLTEASRINVDLHFGNSLLLTVHATDTIAFPNSGTGADFTLAVAEGTVGSNLILANGTNYCQLHSAPDHVYLNQTANSITIIQGTTWGGGIFIIKNVSTDGWAMNDIPFHGPNNNLTSDVANWTYDGTNHQQFLSTGLGIGMNAGVILNHSNMSGMLEIWEVASPTYVDVDRWTGGSHLFNKGMASATKAALVVDDVITSTKGIQMDLNGNLMSPASLSAGQQFDPGLGWLEANSSTAARASIYIKPSGTITFTNNVNGILSYDSVLDVLNFRHGGVTTNLLASGGGGFANPMTAAGQLIFGGSSGTPTATATPAHANMRPFWNGSVVLWTDTTANGAATPGGSNGNLQFNSSGAFAGIGAVNWNGSQLALGSPVTPGTLVANDLIFSAGSGPISAVATAAQWNRITLANSSTGNFENQIGFNTGNFIWYSPVGGTNGTKTQIMEFSQNGIFYTGSASNTNGTPIGGDIDIPLSGRLMAGNSSTSFGTIAPLDGSGNTAIKNFNSVGGIVFGTANGTGGATTVFAEQQNSGRWTFGTTTDNSNGQVQIFNASIAQLALEFSNTKVVTFGVNTSTVLAMTGLLGWTVPSAGFGTTFTAGTDSVVIAHNVNGIETIGLAPAPANFYTTDGTLSGNRTVSGGGNSLTLGSGGSNLSTLTVTTTGGTLINGGSLAIRGATYNSSSALLLPASTSTLSSFNVAVGSDPTTPNDGSGWYNGINFWFNNNGTKKDMIPTKAEADFTGLTGNANLATFTPVAAGTYRVGGYITVTSISLDVIQLQVTWTDETSTSRTLAFVPMGLTSAAVSTTGATSYPTADIRVKAGTAVTISGTLTTGTGSIAYDGGGSIQIVQ